MGRQTLSLLVNLRTPLERSLLPPLGVLGLACPMRRKLCNSLIAPLAPTCLTRQQFIFEHLDSRFPVLSFVRRHRTALFCERLLEAIDIRLVPQQEFSSLSESGEPIEIEPVDFSHAACYISIKEPQSQSCDWVQSQDPSSPLGIGANEKFNDGTEYQNSHTTRDGHLNGVRQPTWLRLSSHPCKSPRLGECEHDQDASPYDRLHDSNALWRPALDPVGTDCPRLDHDGEGDDRNRLRDRRPVVAHPDIMQVVGDRFRLRHQLTRADRHPAALGLGSDDPLQACDADSNRGQQRPRSPTSQRRYTARK